MRVNGDSPDHPSSDDKDFSQLDRMLLDDQSILNKKSALMMGIIREQSEKNDSNSGSDSGSPRKIAETQPFNNDFFDKSFSKSEI